MEKIIGIYKITSPSGKIYIGQSTNILFRWRYHYEKLRCKSQLHLYNSLKKYGVENHIFKIVKKCLADELDKFEIHYISKYNSTNKSLGLNHREGGNGKIVSKSTLEKMKKAALGNKNMLGKKHTQETKDQISKSRLGIKPNKKTKYKMSLARIGFKHSPETMKKILASNLGNHSKKKIINTKTKVIYNSMKEAAESINKTRGSLYSHFHRGTNKQFNLEYYGG